MHRLAPPCKLPQKQDVAVLRRLLAMGANGMTALHFAAIAGQAESMRVLVQHGADKDATDAVGATPLHFAAVQWWAGVVGR